MLREHFPIFERQIFLNSCSKGALSHDVAAAYHAYLHDWETLGSPWELWMEKLEQARRVFARLIHADPDEVAVSTSVSALVSALASAITFAGDRRRVLLPDFEFPTVAQVWHAQEPRGAEVVHLPEVGGRLPLEAVAAELDERTAIVSLTHVSYRHGAKQDARAVAELAHEQGAWLLLDAYQTLGTTPIDVRALDVDFLVGGALKYLLGSSGLAFLYVRRELQPQLFPTTTGWFAQEDIFAMDPYAHRPAQSARRFEAGTPAVPNLYAGVAGLELIDRVGVPRIEAEVRALTTALKAGALERGFVLATPAEPEQHGALIALKALQVEELVARLAADGIIVSSRADNLRISPHFYNTADDIAALLGALERHAALLARAVSAPGE